MQYGKCGQLKQIIKIKYTMWLSTSKDMEEHTKKKIS